MTDIVDEFSPKLAAAFIEACPDALVTECGLFNRKTVLRLRCEFADGSNQEFFSNGRFDPEFALRQAKQWGEEMQHQRKAS